MANVDLQGIQRERLRAYKELSARLDRAAVMEKEIARIRVQKNLLGKGRRVKLPAPVDEFGEPLADAVPVYRWKLDRKK